MIVALPGLSLTSFKPRYCSFNYSKLSWNAKDVSTMGTTSFDVRPRTMSFNCRHQLNFFALKQKKITSVSRIVAIDETWVRT